MLKSMTGFGAGTAEDESYRVLIELKSVNQRYLEVGFHMPHKIDAFAEGMKKKIKESKLSVSEQEELKLLRERNEYLEMENEYLKKLDALVSKREAAEARAKKQK